MMMFPEDACLVFRAQHWNNGFPDRSLSCPRETVNKGLYLKLP